MKYTIAILPIAATAISIIVFFFVQPHVDIDIGILRHIALPICSHIVLITAPRHGSSWFIDSVEGCPSHEAPSHDYTDIIMSTELWASHKGPIYNITAGEAADYVTRNRSVKLFPPVKRLGEKRLREFLGLVRARGVPVFMLKRKHKDAFGSFQEARRTKTWNGNTRGVEKKREVVPGKGFAGFRTMLDTYFERVENALMDMGVVWDEVHYEDIKNRRRIVGERNSCVVRNCNLI